MSLNLRLNETQLVSARTAVRAVPLEHAEASIDASISEESERTTLLNVAQGFRWNKALFSGTCCEALTRANGDETLCPRRSPLLE
jgi:hypothetical protein